MADKMELEELGNEKQEVHPTPQQHQYTEKDASANNNTSTTINSTSAPVDSLPKNTGSDKDSTSDSSKESKGKKGKKGKKDEVEVEKPKTVSYFSLYRFATKKDFMYIALGFVGSLAVGVGQPLVAVLMGNVVDSLILDFSSMTDLIVKFTIIGAVMFVCAYAQMCFFTLAAENQTKRIREEYLHAILRQDIGWHDTGKQSESLTTRLNSDTQIIYDGLADKVGTTVTYLTTFLGGFIIGFIKGWKLALVLLSCVPLIGICAAMMTKFTVQSTSKGQDSYSKAGAVAEQTFSSIRTVAAFGGQKRETQTYIKHLEEAFQAGRKKAIAVGLGVGAFMFILFGTYALAFWFGSREVLKGNMTGGDVMMVFMGMIMGAFSLGQIGPNVSAFASAQGAAYNIFQTIDRVPVIDSSDPNGIKPDNLQGHIVVKDVDFVYPSRPDVAILKKMSIEVKAGQTVALVGHSGSGKSTIVGLLERFYNPVSGSITLDGKDIKDYNVTFLRESIGIVSQEPVLFNATIKENIIYGIRRGQSIPTDAEVEQACRLSNAHDFISRLPQKYNTMVGEKGALLSGGQKQRIAIARALIKNPKILLLDEATSALDTESERIVQAALDNAAEGRSTIVIAHRLSTIMNANWIYVMDKGIVLEEGTHESLLAQGGVYAELVAKQQVKTGGVDEDRVLEDAPGKAEVGGHHITYAEDDAPHKDGAHDRRRSSFSLSNKLRRMSSVRSHRSEKSLQKADSTVYIPETPEEIEERKKKEAAALIKAQKAPIIRVLKLMRPEWTLLAFGAILSGGAGAVFPMFARFFGTIIGLLMAPIPPGGEDHFKSEANHNSGMLAIIAVAAMVSMGGSVLVFELAGEMMARRMRTLSFQAIISQEMGFFDEESHNTGALTSRLATDAYQMHELVSQIMRLSVNTLVTVVLSLGFAFSTSWRLTLVVLALIPVMAASQYFALGSLAGFSQKSKKAYEMSGRVAAEAIGNIRTVVTLAKEDRFEERYEQVTRKPHAYATRRAWLGSFGHALSQAIMFWAYALGFYAGYRFIENKDMEPQELFTTMFYVIFLAMGLGQMATQMPKFFKGKESAINVFELLDKKTTIDADKDGIELAQIDGSLGLENVAFHYPTRPDIQIFKNVTVSVKPFQTVALVGPSGCGKSTIIALLERWYDVLGGKAVIDQYDVRDLQLNNIRNHMALVGQEPVLFDISIGENIRY
ncbi:Multidrug resistance protein 1, partial [Actinomortierella ambigua]